MWAGDLGHLFLRHLCHCSFILTSHFVFLNKCFVDHCSIDQIFYKSEGKMQEESQRDKQTCEATPISRCEDASMCEEKKACIFPGTQGTKALPRLMEDRY